MSACKCGEAATVRLYLHYSRPRPVMVPLATDPQFVHGGWPVRTCGSAGCEAEAYAGLLAAYPDAEVSVDTEATA